MSDSIHELVASEAPQVATPPVIVPANPRTITRIWCGFIFGLCAAMMAVGLYLPPDPFHDGLGTHQQLGFPSCGFLAQFGFPCPTCGCTTAVSYVAHGNLLGAFVTQPFGALVGLLGIAGIIFGGMGLVTGKWYGPCLARLNAYASWILVGSIVILLAAWGYKIFAYSHGIHW